MENLKLTYRDFERIEKLEAKAEKFLSFSKEKGDRIEISSWSNFCSDYVGSHLYCDAVIEAAKKEAERQYHLIQEQINFIKDQSREESERITFIQNNIQVNISENSSQDVENSAPSIIRKIFKKMKTLKS